jgi:hypothetical protein
MQLEFNLPTPTIFKLAQPWIFYGGKLFQSGQELDESNNNYIEFSDLKFNLDEIESPKGLEDLYFIKNKDVIETLQEKYMMDAANTEYRSKRAIEEELGQNKVLSLLVTKILPVITNFSLDDQLTKMIEEEQGISHQDNFLEVMAQGSSSSNHTSGRSTTTRSDVQRQKQHLVNIISEQYKQFEVNNSQPNTNNAHGTDSVMIQLNQTIERNLGSNRGNSLDDGSIFTSQIAPGKNIMFDDNKIYDLVSTTEWVSYFKDHIQPTFYNQLQGISTSTDPEEVYGLIKENLQLVEKRYLSRLLLKLKSSKLKIDNNYYFPIHMEEDNVNDIQLLYKKLIEKDVKLKAIDHNEFQAIQMGEIQRQREQLSKIANLTHFELNGAGYEINNGQFYAYVTTEKYALKSPHINGSKKYLPMPAAKIGVPLSYDNRSRKINIGNPIIMNQYQHPFLSDYKSMQTLCLGQYNPSHAKRLDPEQAVTTLLSKAKEIILMGYRSGSNPYRKLRQDSWSGWLTKREMERRDLVCLNDFST